MILVDAKRAFAKQISDFESGARRIDADERKAISGLKDFFGTEFTEEDNVYQMEVCDLNQQWHRAAFCMRSEEKLLETFEFLEIFGSTPRFKVKPVVPSDKTQ